MARYLVVAHQTASSLELVERVKALASSDRAAEFVLLVPETPVEQMLGSVEGEAAEVAERRAHEARARLEEAGAKVVRTSMVGASPLVAIDEELWAHRGEYEAIVICTLPVGVSRWLRLDLPHRVERRFSLPVIHVVAESTAATAVTRPVSFDTMLVPLNGSASESILGPVTFLAKRLASRVSLVRVSNEAEDGGEAESYLDQVARMLGDEGLAVDIAVLAGDAGRAIVDYASEESFGMVAMATCRHGSGDTVELGDVTMKVLDACSCPLLLTRPGSGNAGARSGEISRVVVPLDGSHLAEDALPYAERLARRLTLPVSLIEVISATWQQAVEVPASALSSMEASPDRRRSFSDHPLHAESRLDVSTTSYLSDVCQRLIDKGVEATWHAPWGVPRDAILEHVGREDGNLIVLSSHGASGGERTSVGSVTHALLRAAPTPVLTVPPASL
jgi:nucleotide-binding universal stress UspA family protein